MFITFEGIDGSGKSTQARLLARRLAHAELPGLERRPVILTREPGDGNQEIRQILLHGDLRHPYSELLLFLADRCEHVEKTIRPALDAGSIIICDRYHHSTIAYQCGMRGLPRDHVRQIFDMCQLPQPDLTFFIDVPERDAMRRIASRGEGGNNLEQGVEALRVVRNQYVEMQRAEPHRIIKINGQDKIQHVHRHIMSKIRLLLRQDR